MFNRKKLYRERLEIYLVYALRIYRPFLGLAGVAGCLVSLYVLNIVFEVGSILMVISILPVLIAVSDPLLIYCARGLAWLATQIKRDF